RTPTDKALTVRPYHPSMRSMSRIVGFLALLAGCNGGDACDPFPNQSCIALEVHGQVGGGRKRHPALDRRRAKPANLFVSFFAGRGLFGFAGDDLYVVGRTKACCTFTADYLSSIEFS